MKTQIHHATANKLYNAGVAVTICPCKLSPWAFQNAFSYVVYPADELNEGCTFREIVKSFKWHNCVDNATGRNCTYWV